MVKQIILEEKELKNKEQEKMAKKVIMDDKKETRLLKNENDAMFSENCHVTHLSNHFPCHRQFWRYAVGILLVPKTAWHNSRGYSEDNTKHNNMEHGFIMRLKNKYNLVNLGKKLNYPFYHIQHEVDDSKNREQNPYQRPRDLAKLPFCINNEDWG